MRFVPVKTTTQQAQRMVLKVRETLISQRTQLVNALRGHAAEFGIIAAKGISQLTPLLEALEAATTIPSEAREMLTLLGQEIDHLDTRLKEIEVILTAEHKANAIGDEAGILHAVQGAALGEHGLVDQSIVLRRDRPGGIRFVDLHLVDLIDVQVDPVIGWIAGKDAVVIIRVHLRIFQRLPPAEEQPVK
jgi:hypothetical protein